MYCQRNDIEVNAGKSQVVIFGGFVRENNKHKINNGREPLKSRDIRSYFQCKGKVSGTSPTISSSNGQKVRNEKEKKKKRTLIVSDSDEESDVVVQSPLKKSKQNEKLPATQKQKKHEEKSKYFSASASDVFGSAPVKQISKNVPIPKNVPKTIPESPTVDSGIESQDSHSLEIHDNDEFAAVLSQLDEHDWTTTSPGSCAKETLPPPFESKMDITSPRLPCKTLSSQRSPLKTSSTSLKNKEYTLDNINQKDSLVSPSRVDLKPFSNLNSNQSKLETSPISSKSRKFDRVKSFEESRISPQKSPKKRVKSPLKSEKFLDRSTPVNEESKKLKVAKGLSKSPVIERVESKLQSATSFYGTKQDTKSKSSPSSSTPKPSILDTSSSTFSLWVDKYKPKSTKQIVGQQGDKSVVNKLLKWLKNWHRHQSGTKKLIKPSPWAKDDDGAYFKAALLSGPPGIGKTTTVTLVCQELSFDVVEFNASDTRSKRLLQEEVSTLLSCSSLTPYFSGGGDGKNSTGVTRNHVLVMDEVDGMAGNEDRGGVQELIQLIKSSKVPVICMCNDRSHPKIRSLVNYCFDLPFHRPRVEQIKAAMMSICFKEGLKVTSQIMADIITNSNQDIRSTLNQLSMLAAQGHGDNVQAEAKNVKMGPWDVLRKVFSAEDQKSMSIFDKSDLFFHDYQVAPLFVHENYLSVTPHNVDKNSKSSKMVLFAKAAESLSRGDLIEKQIRQNSSWSLLPTQAMFSSVLPGHYLAGHVSGRIQFPMWFGKNSRGNKLSRLIQEIQVHTRLRMSSSKESINLDYMRYLRDAILEPLVQSGSDGVAESLALLQHYCLTREDLDSICEVASWPNGTDPMSKIESKVKAAFTRAYNKASIVTPYALTAPVKKGKGPKADEEQGMEDTEEGEQEGNEEEEEENVDTDAMIMARKKPTSANSKAAGSASSSEASSSSGKGGGKAGRAGKGSRGGKK